jgi:hypothetical protein
MRSKLFLKISLLFSLICTGLFAQADSIKFNYREIFASALDGNMSGVLRTIDVDTNKLSIRDRKMKNAFESRFGFSTDRDAPQGSPIEGLLAIFKDYWRKSLLDNSVNYDSLLIRNLTAFLANEYAPAKSLTASSADDSIDVYLKKYIGSLNLYTTGYGRTGRLLDLLVWKTQKDTVYSFSVSGESLEAPVTFMQDFVTLGWEQYATLGKLHPGGWATQESLFCVKSAYDLSSEDFLIGYLAHEGRHFTDYKLFPKLGSADLEYRAKLTELSMLETTLFTTLEFFIANSKAGSENGHSHANYCVIRDLSRVLFHSEFESDIAKWKQLGPEAIHKAAAKTLKTNTRLLKKQGKDVSSVIR